MTLSLYLFQFSLVISLFSSDANTLFPDIDGFQKNGDVEIYNHDYLFDYINGAADSYLKYDFEELKLAKYKN